LNEKPILIVEDNPDDIALTILAFEQNNITNELIITNDGVEALDYLFARGRYSDRDKGKTPAFILLDLQLPRINGFDVLKTVREETLTRLIPVIILSTSTEARDVSSSYSLGANSYIRKPVDYEQFRKTVQLLGRYWLELNLLQ